MKIALCCIAKCENLYLSEWVNHHLNLGFDHIYIYDNNDTDGERCEDIVGKENPNVTVLKYFIGKKQKGCEIQIASYNDFYQRFGGKYDWVLYLDVDEFLVINGYKNVCGYIKDITKPSTKSVRVNWKCYDDNDNLHYECLPVRERFTRVCEDETLSYYKKHFYRTKLNGFKAINVHYSNIRGDVVDCDGNRTTYSTFVTSNTCNHNKAYIAHYATKSADEYYMIKKKRRVNGIGNDRLSIEHYFKFNKRTEEKEKYLNNLFNGNIKPIEFEKSKVVVDNEKPTEGISVCITAYNAQDFIEECLDSVAEQTWFKTHNNWEVIVGIDGCERTLLKMKEIMHKYKNLRVLMMDSNKGTYVTSNTIMKEAKYKWLLRFDSDDIMLPNMIDSAFSVKKRNAIVQFKFDSFGDTKLEATQKEIPARGIIMIEKYLLSKLGGYRDWLCSADSNLYERAKILNCDIITTNCTTFYRRLHKDSLCFDSKTKIKDNKSIRTKYQKLTKKDIANKVVFVEPVCNSFSDIKNEILPKHNNFVVDQIDYKGFLKCKNKIHVLIVDYKQLKYTQHIISNLLIQNTSFDLTVFEQQCDELSKQYFIKLQKEWNLSNCSLNVIFNSVNAPLNHIWNWFYTHTNNQYLAFLNNDIEICNNFISDAETIFEKEKKCGIIIHPTNRPEYTKNNSLIYEKVNGYPVLQGWDFIINRSAYTIIPDNLWIWRGDVYLMTNSYNNGWEQFYDVSSPVLHYTSSTVETYKNDIQAILDNDKFHWNEMKLKECVIRDDNKYMHRLFNGVYPIDLTKKIVVSFTTWKKRIGNVNGVVEQMMNQTKKPDLIILNLSYKEFKYHKNLLKDVFLLEKNNSTFKVNMVDGENTKVWKKWIPIIDKYNNDLIIPIDDDIVYPNDFIEKLYNKWLKTPYNPITGDLVFLGGFLQAHCGAGSLIFRQAFGIYINDYKKIIDKLYASDVFYSFAAYMNGYNYIKEGMNVLKFERHDELEPYSHGKSKTIPKQPQLMDMDFLTDYYLNTKYII